MSMNEYQRIVCFALPPTPIAVAGFTSTVCKFKKIAIEIHKYASRKNEINRFKCILHAVPV